MRKILFISEKWCDCLPHYVYSHSFYNFLMTFYQEQPNYLFNMIYYDEAYHIYKQHINEILPRYCMEHQIPIILFAYAGNSPYNPSLYCLKELKKLGIFLGFIWWDSNPGDLSLRDAFKDVSDLNVIVDVPVSKTHDSRPRLENELYLFTPQDKTLYYPGEQDTDISFIGSTRQPYRKEYLALVKEHFPSLVIAGGQRESLMSPYEYAKLIRRSKINLNFSFGNGFDQLKGRTLETLMSKSLLIENKNLATASKLTPGHDYIDFDTTNDLLDKIKYYLEHPLERQKIADQGHKTYSEKYTANIFWKEIMTFIENKV